MEKSIKTLFDQVAKDYDYQRHQLIPCFDEFYGTAVDWVKTTKQKPRILDLGAGTGLFAAFVQQKYPQAEFTLIDLSEEMMRAARLRFEHSKQVEYIAADYTKYMFKQKYDIVISSLSIHHLSHESKQELFHTVHELLEDDGSFINADQAAGSLSCFDLAYKDKWERHIGKGELAEQAIESAIERRKLDQNATVQDQLQWLHNSGFAAADCVYKHHEFAVFAAFKQILKYS
ncbi:methyltransferase [Paenibacillus sp. BIHB 4019]|uniref:Methyltransferase n=1 Tax=Paenibacillus sp. BIHB 4019 TaxID=1870819 RepID=A0A1B2DFG3_9BACL|nr:class I SAM-dependent methyltransferase [Paenibacillus sp. BIHB 4019]ANY66462.1 methyltransferase [Paenibacillus sp. BIHB 4019]